MRKLLRCIKSDYLKTKHTPLRTAHLAIPCAMAAVFLAYCAYAPWDAYSKAEAYFQVMGLGYPLLIGIFCAIVAEQEACAGAYQMMLSVTDRKISFASKLAVLVLPGAFSVTLASALFGTGYDFVLGQHVLRYSFYWVAAAVMLGSNLFLYICHLFLALRFDRGVTVGLGVAESLLSALLLTGLGDHLWICVPAAWGSRLVCSLMRAYSVEEMPLIDCREGLWVCGAATVAAFVAYEIWGCRWDGAKGNA